MVIQCDVRAAALNVPCSRFDDDLINELPIQGSVSNNKTQSDINTNPAKTLPSCDLVLVNYKVQASSPTCVHSMQGNVPHNKSVQLPSPVHLGTPV